MFYSLKRVYTLIQTIGLVYLLYLALNILKYEQNKYRSDVRCFNFFFFSKKYSGSDYKIKNVFPLENQIFMKKNCNIIKF